MIEQNQIYTVEFNNLRRVHRNRANGELFAIEIEITEDEWHHLSDFPQDALGEAALRWTDRTMAEEQPKQKREPKPKPEPTPYGQFWQKLILAGFYNNPTMQQVMANLREAGATGSDEEITRAAFGVPSRSFVSPSQLRQWLAEQGAADDLGLMSLVSRAEREK